MPGNQKTKRTQNKMNWLWYSVCIILIEEAIDFYVSWRQLCKYRNDRQVPTELEGTIKQEDFLASCKYNGDKMSFNMLQSGFNLVLSLTLLLTFAYPYVWNKVGTMTGTDSEAAQSLAFLLIMMLVGQLLSLPWDLYMDFVIEERHGFNRKTLGLFFMDMLKTMFLSVVIGGPVTVVTIKLVRWAGPQSYLWLWAFAVVFIIFMTYAVPIFILPMFNKYEPLKDHELKKKVDALASRIGFPLNKLYQIDESKRTTHSNAFMYGFWNNKCIVLYDTLLKLDHEEIVAVLAHELGHWKKWHTVKLLVATFAQLFLYMYLFQLVVFNSKPFEDFGYHKVNAVVVGIYIFSRVVTPLNELLGRLLIMASRIHEFQADRFAKDLGYAAQLRSSLIKMGIESKVAFNPDKWYAWMNYTHPTLAERLAALKEEKQE
eukprot:Gregarina_sp_Pseudo_9__2828@NODE_305_length_3209_cov_56_840379_g286_i0_p1_GENE_NODE_305_length_3209_cov_56_840379_g286_i0NODE_305_length_3209_cov_56_840379_g286_i0_p1_ORF_typecomplete_len429_score60_35Peptidase_M48_N/PF16491_5/2_6e56Peptidase_M48_N/PF16491_5/3_4e03Peptidase_M48/PF01435_18/2_1e03Peptidase_M48/PF01435_18/1_3e44Peptidase_M56/PF05569_11/9e13Peptidase_M56/PF05569_11/9_6e02Peptidase_M78/PF06114_13/0_039Peptidase_U49/PF10463_9/31Peptidase_U49/PF10463_9/0_59DUF3139/PF11337_8/5e02DUF3139